MGYPGSPLQPAGHPPPTPQAGRLLGLLGRGSGVSAKCPGWVVGTSLCSDGRSSSCGSKFPAQGERSFCRTGDERCENSPVSFGVPLALTPVASPCRSASGFQDLTGCRRCGILSPCPVPWRHSWLSLAGHWSVWSLVHSQMWAPILSLS